MPGLITPEVLEQIRAASDIVEVVGGYFPLKRAGANFVALCPFHKEKTPSFHVNPHRQIFHCFGCHKGGDVFTFIREYENLTFLEAVKRLAERARIPLVFEDQPGQPQQRQVKEVLLQMHEQIAQRWQNALANEAGGQMAREYLAKRGVTEEAVKLFRLGCAPEAWDDTVNWAKSKGYELAQAEQAGLILRKEGSDRYYDRFRGRLIFPIGDEQGRVIGFSGRVLAGDEKTAKYVNSPETPIFHKGKVFYGLDKSKRALLEAGFAVVCEGQLDLISCYMAGVRNIVAPQGTAFTADHARMLKRYVEEVVLCFDSDTAGQAAAVRVLDSLLASGLAIRVATVPAPHDPDSFIKEKGGAAFHQLIERAEGFFDYYLNRLCATHDVGTDRGRLALLREFGAAINKTGHAVLIDKYAQKAAQRLGVAPEATRLEFKKISPPRRVGETEAGPGEEFLPEIERPSAQELWLLKLLLQDPAPVEWLGEHLDPAWVRHVVARRIMVLRLAAHASQKWQNVAAFLAEHEDAEMRSLMTEAVTDERDIPHPEQQLYDVVKRLRDQFIERQIAELTRQLAQPETGEAERIGLLQQQQQLRRVKLGPLTPQGLRRATMNDERGTMKPARPPPNPVRAQEHKPHRPPMKNAPGSISACEPPGGGAAGE